MSEDEKDRLHAAKMVVRVAIIGAVHCAPDRHEALAAMIAFLRDEAALFSECQPVRCFLLGEPGIHLFPAFPPDVHIFPAR